MTDQKPSEEILNAFVDGEFSPEDRLHTLQFIASDERLSREICDLYQLKELVSHAYRDGSIPPSQPRGPAAVRNVNIVRVAAAVLCTVGMGLLLFMVHAEWTEAEPLAVVPGLEALDPERTNTFLPAILGESAGRVLLHVTDVGVADAESLFDDIEFLFKDAQVRGRDLLIQVVVHGDSMDLVRADLAPFPERMRDLLDRYPGLRLTACGQSRARLSRGEGKTLQLLPWVEEVESGIREAALKQLEGWAYIRL